MLNSLDLFSGLGGISHSLRGFVNPLAYCDIDPICRTAIEARISTNDLPEAPVLRDVRDTKAILCAVAGRKVDVIISSSSCVGFSMVGGRAGLAHPDTKLFLDVLDLLKLLQVPMLFMENVGAILTSNGGKDYDLILRLFSDLGYRITWCVLTAEHVGAWHTRRRWFALAYKPWSLARMELQMPVGMASIKRFGWTMANKPIERIAMPRKNCVGVSIAAEVAAVRNVRMKMLGNAVVPDCTRLAFLYLFSGGRVTDITARTIHHNEFDAAPERFRFTARPGRVAAFPSFGISSRSDGAAHAHALGPIPFKRVMLGLRINPARGSGIAGGRETSKGLKGIKVMDRYMTPVASNPGPCRVLTDRCMHNLSAQTRFMVGVPHGEGTLNPRFVEFLMGYPRDWTDTRFSVSRSKTKPTRPTQDAKSKTQKVGATTNTDTDTDTDKDTDTGKRSQFVMSRLSRAWSTLFKR